MATKPLRGAVQLHQTDFPPAFPPCTGSPGSLVAPTLDAVRTLTELGISARVANISLVGTSLVGVKDTWSSQPRSLPARTVPSLLYLQRNVCVPTGTKLVF